MDKTIDKDLPKKNQYDVNFVSITQSIDTKSPMGRLLRNILFDFAQFEREMISDRTRDKMQQRAQKGLWNGGLPPYGYTRKEKMNMTSNYPRDYMDTAAW